MSEEKPQFQWAYDEDANVKKPIEDLYRKGWQYEDVPTASNFNWVFNRIQKDLESIAEDLGAIKKLAADIKTVADRAHYQSVANRNNVLQNKGYVRQICRGLREMEKNLELYHRDFPTIPWPLDDA